MEKIRSEDIAKMLQINFVRESLCHNVNVTADSIDKIIIKDGFLMVHDVYECCWHCYNINHITHFHYPDYVKGGSHVRNHNEKQRNI